MTTLVIGTGSFLPEVVDRDAGRTRRVHSDQATSDLATQAARRALADARVSAQEVDVIVVSTCTSDYIQPPTAALVQANLETKAKYVQLDVGCSGFVEAMLVADSMLCSGQFRTALVVGADTLSRICDPASSLSRDTFGDGAGAVVLARRDDADGYGVGDFYSGSDVHAYDHASMEAGGSRLPYDADVLEHNRHLLSCDYSRIEAWATQRMTAAVRGVVRRAGLALDDLTWVVPQQTSAEVASVLANQLDLPRSRFVETFAQTGNTASSSLPIALDQAKRRGLFAHGDRLVLPAAGTGTGWGAFLYRWFSPGNAAHT
jgi:3-oxoacyl-[acyl-carrier-protein] synthase-3